MERIRLMIVDDYEPLRVGLRAVFENEEDFEVVADLADGESAIREAEKIRPDVVVMNVRMPSMRGIEACRLLRDSVPDANVVMLTSSEDERVMTASLMAGAHCLLLKRGGPDKLLRAARAAARGETLMDPHLIRRSLDNLRQQTAAEQSRESSHRRDADAALSSREREVLHLIAQTLTNGQIARALYIRRRRAVQQGKGGSASHSPEREHRQEPRQPHPAKTPPPQPPPSRRFSGPARHSHPGRERGLSAPDSLRLALSNRTRQTRPAPLPCADILDQTPDVAIIPVEALVGISHEPVST